MLVAITDDDQDIDLDPEDAEAYFDRGLAYAEKGDRAIADYDQAIALDPQFALAYNNRGIAYGQRGDLNRAIANF